MEKGFARQQRARWLSRPLCRRYAAGFFSHAPVTVTHGGAPEMRLIHWAIGSLQDGESEILGAWFEQAVMADDLKARGVEGFGYQLEWGHEEAKQSALAACPSMSLCGQIADRCQAALDRALARHGYFSDQAAVLDFIASTLMRVERRLERSGYLAAATGRFGREGKAAPVAAMSS